MICPGCGEIVPQSSSPCPRMLTSQDAVLLAAARLGLNLDQAVPDDKPKEEKKLWRQLWMP